MTTTNENTQETGNAILAPFHMNSFIKNEDGTFSINYSDDFQAAEDIVLAPSEMGFFQLYLELGTKVAPRFFNHVLDHELRITFRTLEIAKSLDSDRPVPVLGTYIAYTALLTEDEKNLLCSICANYIKDFEEEWDYTKFKMNDGTFKTFDLVFLHSSQIGSDLGKILHTSETGIIHVITLNAYQIVKDDTKIEHANVEDFPAEMIEKVEKDFEKLIEKQLEYVEKTNKYYSKVQAKISDLKYKEEEMGVIYADLMSQASKLVSLDEISAFRTTTMKGVKLSKDMRTELLLSLQVAQTIIGNADVVDITMKIAKIGKEDALATYKGKLVQKFTADQRKLVNAAFKARKLEIVAEAKAKEDKAKEVAAAKLAKSEAKEAKAVAKEAKKDSLKEAAVQVEAEK